MDEEENYYFATVDMDFERPERRGLPYDQIEGLVDGIFARKKLVLIDSCQAGEIDRMETQKANATLRDPLPRRMMYSRLIRQR